MAKNLLVINVDIRETRVALIENGIIVELHIERETSRGTLGNIYLGKVSRVLPGMQAAFIDIGLERAAFLHVEDLIRPDDFESYLAGQKRGPSGTEDDRSAGRELEAEESRTTPRAVAARDARPPLEPPAASRPEHDPGVEPDEPQADAPRDATAADLSSIRRAEPVVPHPTVDVEGATDAPTLEVGGAPPFEEGIEAVEEGGAAHVGTLRRVDSSLAQPVPIELASAEDGADEPNLEPDAPEADSPTAIATDAGAGEEGVATRDESGLASRGRARRGRGRHDARIRRSGRTVDRRLDHAAAEDRAPTAILDPATGDSATGRVATRARDRRDERPQHAGRATRDAKRSQEPPRVTKQTPIRDVVREGQEVIVQVSKEPIGTKGARVTSHVSLPGRYVVYLPTVDHVGISKRIGSDKERQRLRDAIEAMKPPQGGLIVRTLAEGLTKKQLKADVGYLVRIWGEVAKKREGNIRAPACLYTELDLVLKTARDLFTDDIEKIVIDSADEFQRLRRFVEVFMPERADAVELYQGSEPVFDAYGIEDEIQRAQSRKVPLPSGGYLIIDQAEALTAIDVNTGRFVGKGSRDLEETILATNLEAVEEIAYQLRFRNIGGLIILDLIDMDRPSSREKVRRRLEDLLAKDKAKTALNRISDLGLIEMTRKRTRESLGRTVLEPCFYCDGTGQLQSKQTIAYEILRQIRRERLNLPGYVVTVNAHPAVIDLLKSDERVAVTEAERLFQRRIELVPRKEYHLEQFDLQGR
jgi:ribonuclease G